MLPITKKCLRNQFHLSWETRVKVPTSYYFLKKHPLIKKTPKNSKKFSSKGQLIPLFLFYFLPEYCSKLEVREDECDEVCCID